MLKLDQSSNFLTIYTDEEALADQSLSLLIKVDNPNKNVSYDPFTIKVDFFIGTQATYE